MTLRVSNMPSEAGETLKLELATRFSMVEPWRTNKLPIWLYTVLKMMPVAYIGRSLMIDFSSSTCVTVQSLHGFIAPLLWSDCTSTAALSKKLKI